MVDQLSDVIQSMDHYGPFRKAAQETLKIGAKLKSTGDPLSRLTPLLSETSIGRMISEHMRESFHGEDSCLEDKMCSDYMSLDLVGFSSDKIKKNRSPFYNITTDARHCYYASHCQVYATQDERAHNKAMAVYAHHGIKTEVFDIAGFITWLKSNTNP
jgi:hypothetical protein